MSAETSGGYGQAMGELWHELHQAGMAAAASKTASRRLSGSTLAAVRRDYNERHPCGVKGCKRTAFKGALCRGHYGLVPRRMAADLMFECMTAQRKIAAKHHRKQLAYVRALPADSP